MEAEPQLLPSKPPGGLVDPKPRMASVRLRNRSASARSENVRRTISTSDKERFIARRISHSSGLSISPSSWVKARPCNRERMVVIESPYRSLLRPLLAYVDTVKALYPEDMLTVILPEFVVAHWWEYLLHNQTAFQLKNALQARHDIVVTDIPQHLRSRTRKGRG